MHTFKNKVSIRIGNEAVDGFLSFTSERVLFSREDDDKEETSWKAFQIYFKSVCVHAIESLVVHASPEEEKKEGKKVGEKCLYLQVEGELDPLIVRNAIERSDEDEEDDSFEEPATEVRIFPLLSDDEEGKEEEEEERMVLEEMFERMNECAMLNPDTEDENENDENDDVDARPGLPKGPSRRFCVVGSGPAGMYATSFLLSHYGDRVTVDVVERDATPFGLVRSGVAPDHASTKSVTNRFDGILADARVAFHGNVALGSDVALRDLRARYHAIILAHGADGDKRLGVPGEETTPGVYGAREFVGWYNGDARCAATLGATGRDPVGARIVLGHTACVFGLGNVALDCARMLLRDADDLASTDVAGEALGAFRRVLYKSSSPIARFQHLIAPPFN